MKRFPSAYDLNRIADAFKVDPAELFIKTHESEVINAIKPQQERKNHPKKTVRNDYCLLVVFG
jgi:hypothetical protein